MCRWPRLPQPRRGSTLPGRTGHAEAMASLVTDDEQTRFAVEWLIESPEPAIRALACTELLDEPAGKRLALGSMVDLLLGGDEPGEVLDAHPYTKWVGAHWRLVSLVELGVPADDPRLPPLVDHVLTWLAGGGRLARVPKVAGRTRRCASQEGNALAVCSRLGLAGDQRARMLAESLVDWQWPDGGWNCDRRPEARHSSFHETHPPIWGLHEYAWATGDPDAAEAARRGAELLLERHLFRRRSDGEVVHRSWVALHYPPYWHYDILQGSGCAVSPRTRRRRACRRRAGPAGAATARRWTLAPGRLLVAAPRQQPCPRGRRLGTHQRGPSPPVPRTPCPRTARPARAGPARRDRSRGWPRDQTPRATHACGPSRVERPCKRLSRHAR